MSPKIAIAAHSRYIEANEEIETRKFSEGIPEKTHLFSLALRFGGNDKPPGCDCDHGGGQGHQAEITTS